ncbi:leucine-rich repeat-containing protein 15-like [Mya arenaria]|uniref:leucine-rich repeat-containing protein 15-like n=1 Tax=Mya arenaria TaxID=6604 RepID=UPI0022E5BCBD|nr:leucine-rich repeat-containing protein 15-like [Mya arenaria]
MTNLSDDAFNCVDSNIVSLDLRGNMFSVLPRALAKLVNLTYLDIQNNPLTTLDYHVMSVIGKHLKEFHVDLLHFNSWPREFRLLRAITTLEISFIQYHTLSTDAFHGMESTLDTLRIEFPHMVNMPIAICQLQNLHSLMFKYNNLHSPNATMIIQCNRSLILVTTLDLSFSNVRDFPDIFQTFPELTSLSLNHNALQYINSDLVPAQNKLQKLYLSYNNFSRIPDAFNKFHLLTELEMQNNHIDAIYDTDFHNLKALTTLYLNDNGLQFISSHAFKYNPKLNDLKLNNNRLRTVSSSITTLHSLRYLYLQNNQIDCTCDLSSLQSWNVSSIYFIYGNCGSSSESLKHYVMNVLPGCQ